jgi:hypothetical protein
MKFYAKINENNIVVDMVPVEDPTTLLNYDPTDQWIAWSNLRIGQTLVEGDDVSLANTPQLNYVYVKEENLFYPPVINPSWIFDRDLWQWKPPIPKPPEQEGKLLAWSEQQLTWVYLNLPPQ